MKQKKLDKKLGLNKQTITNLEAVQMKDIRGGVEHLAENSDGYTECRTSPCGTCGTCASCPPA